MEAAGMCAEAHRMARQGAEMAAKEPVTGNNNLKGPPRGSAYFSQS